MDTHGQTPEDVHWEWDGGNHRMGAPEGIGWSNGKAESYLLEDIDAKLLKRRTKTHKATDKLLVTVGGASG
jgi:hypothetical protein